VHRPDRVYRRLAAARAEAAAALHGRRLRSCRGGRFSRRRARPLRPRRQSASSSAADRREPRSVQQPARDLRVADGMDAQQAGRRPQGRGGKLPRRARARDARRASSELRRRCCPSGRPQPPAGARR
jgi:hypothetical protein